eukprot:UN00562
MVLCILSRGGIIRLLMLIMLLSKIDYIFGRFVTDEPRQTWNMRTSRNGYR